MRPRSVFSVLVAVVVPAVLTGVLVTGAGPALAAPSSQPGGTTGVLASAELTALQDQAADVQTDLQDRQAAVASAQQELDAAQADADVAAQAVVDAEGALTRERVVVGEYASADYRDGGAPTALALLLSGAVPGDVVAAMGYLDVVDARTAEVLTAAEYSGRPRWPDRPPPTRRWPTPGRTDAGPGA